MFSRESALVMLTRSGWAPESLRAPGGGWKMRVFNTGQFPGCVDCRRHVFFQIIDGRMAASNEARHSLCNASSGRPTESGEGARA